MMDIDDDTCKEIFVLAKKVMNVIREVYKSESVYLCTMCDGPMNHFHLQLIPRYSFEERGSDNFVKPRFDYKEDKEKIEKLRELLKN
jgi:diadenosine tetraphosphate (Ap4A) HIT family hydrolase